MDPTEKRTSEERQLAVRLHRAIQDLTRPGTRIVVASDISTDVRVVCDGRIDVQAYFCALAPRHAGRCFSAHKDVHFTPENR